MATKKESKVKRVGYFTMVGKALKGVKGNVSVRKLAAAVQKKFPGKPDEYYPGIILQCAAWCKRNKVACATLVRDHKASKPIAKKGKKIEKDLLA